MTFMYKSTNEAFYLGGPHVFPITRGSERGKCNKIYRKHTLSNLYTLSLLNFLLIFYFNIFCNKSLLEIKESKQKGAAFGN